MERKGRILTEKNTTQVFNTHIHGECFVYKDTKIFNRPRDWYVVAIHLHRSKTGG